jgi:hypothetical protein
MLGALHPISVSLLSSYIMTPSVCLCFICNRGRLNLLRFLLLSRKTRDPMGDMMRFWRNETKPSWPHFLFPSSSFHFMTVDIIRLSHLIEWNCGKYQCFEKSRVWMCSPIWITHILQTCYYFAYLTGLDDHSGTLHIEEYRCKAYHTTYITLHRTVNYFDCISLNIHLSAHISNKNCKFLCTVNRLQKI